MTNLDTVFEELDRFQSHLEDVFYHAVDEYAGRVADELVEKLGIDYPPASQPGEFPHKRTGKLQGGIVYVTESDGHSFNSVISSTRPGGAPGVPGRLNYGLNRPYMTDTYRLVLEDFPNEIRNIIRQRI